MALTKTPIELSSTPSIVDGGNATAITIDSSENVTFNSTVTANVARTSSSSATVLTLKDNVTGAQTNGVYKAIRSESNGTSSVSEIRFIESDGTNNNTAIGFATAASAGAISEKMRIHPGGVVSFLSGIELGSGLDATAANTLEDYEEGTWTSLNEVTGANCTSISHSDSYYTKVGRLVTLSFAVAGTITSAGAETSFKFFLPFPAINNTNQGAGGTANFLIGTGADRFGLGVVYNGTTSSGTAHVYIPSDQMNASGAFTGMRVFMSYITT